LLRCVKNLKRLRQTPNALWPRFPFTRGSGNCLNSTLDAFELTGDTLYLKRAAEIVTGTVSPSDDPDERDLLNAEICWSYTVFLSALGRFLTVKKLWNQEDEEFFYTRECLLLYARWMVQFEIPYLDQSENLEYPNETWAAQDLRKGVVFHYAAKFSSEDSRSDFLTKAAVFFNYGLAELCRHKTSQYTRPLVLMLQNGWGLEAVHEFIEEKSYEDFTSGFNKAIPRLRFSEVGRRLIVDLRSVISQASFSRELAWLRSRLHR
jgi:hypothetical protein